MVIPKHIKPFPREIYVYVVALTPDLRVASFHDARELFYYSSTIKLLLLLVLLKGSYSTFKPFLPSCNPSLAMWLLWTANLYQVVRRDSTSSFEATNEICLGYNDPALSPHGHK